MPARQLLGAPAVTQDWNSCLLDADIDPPGGMFPFWMALFATFAFLLAPA
jgi:hypothetical protein